MDKVTERNVRRRESTRGEKLNIEKKICPRSRCKEKTEGGKEDKDEYKNKGLDKITERTVERNHRKREKNENENQNQNDNSTFL